MTEFQVILVNEKDEPLGSMEKMEAHRKALLHRAISVFIANSKGEWLLQQRAMDKYHSGGLWTNTCCSHPFPGEIAIEAANRRLMEEMGLKCSLNEMFSFIYKEELDNELTEHELDHVFWGVSDDIPEFDKNEVMDWKYLSYDAIYSKIKSNPENYTVWFKKIFERVNSESENLNMKA